MIMHPSFRSLLRRKKTLRMPPPALLSLYYLAFIVLGGILLWLPISHHGDIGLGEALFTSTSAVTVTGLVLADTGAAFTGFGQAVIAGLIQLGGLGLMTFAVLLLGALGISIGMPQRLILREDLNQTSLSNLSYIARMILIIAVACEAVGAALLALVFVPEFGWAGLWEAIFHSISAFNNAGFALRCGRCVPHAGLAQTDPTFQADAGWHGAADHLGQCHVWAAGMGQP